MYRKGFTLAEVLITLAVVGVVAAMTLPSVINKFRAKALETGFKKSYSNINKAFLNAKLELESDSIYRDYAVYNYGYNQFSKFSEVFYKKLNAIEKFKGTYGLKTYSGESSICGPAGMCTVPKTILADGSSIETAVNGGKIWFVVDTNGPYKKPNRRGHDVFTFIINDNSDKIQMLKMEKLYTEDELKNVPYPSFEGYPCSDKSKQEANGIGCAWYAFNNVNPDDSTKTYWDNLPR